MKHGLDDEITEKSTILINAINYFKKPNLKNPPTDKQRHYLQYEENILQVIIN